MLLVCFIPRQVPVMAENGEAVVRFKFGTDGGDICFSANFFGQKDSPYYSTLVRERTREQSQREAVEVRTRQ